MVKSSLFWFLQFYSGFKIKGPERNFEDLEQRGFWQSGSKKEGGFKENFFLG